MTIYKYTKGDGSPYKWFVGGFADYSAVLFCEVDFQGLRSCCGEKVKYKRKSPPTPILTKEKPLMHGRPFVFLMNATSTTHACQPEIWIPFHVPECCVDFIDICGAGGHLAVGVWCRFSQRLLGIAHIVWARSWKLNDGFITTSSESLRLRIASQPHFTPRVCKLGVIQIEGKNILGVKKQNKTTKTSRPHSQKQVVFNTQRHLGP